MKRRIAINWWGSLAALRSDAQSDVSSARARPRPDAAVLEFSQFDRKRSLAGQLMYCFGMVVVWFLFRPVVPHASMNLWAGATIAWQVFWFACFLAMLWRKPGRTERDAFWMPLAYVLVVVSVATVIWAVWLFTPHATDRLRLILVILLLTFVSVAIMTGSNMIHVDGFATVGVLGSLSFNLALGGHITDFILAGFVFVYMFTMLALSSNRLRLVEDIVAAKRSVERERDLKLRFLASAWHDLGQPLQSARLFFDQATRADDPARRTIARASALDAFAAMERQLLQMLDHLRLEAGMVSPEIKPVSASLLIAQASEVAEPLAAAAHIALRLCPSDLVLLADAEMAGRAISNFIHNAIRHAKCRRILVCARRRAGHIRIYVIDDGSGIANADAATLFEDYVQGSNHGDEIRGGFGLGLGSARRIARLLDGEAGHDSRWRAGSAFFLELPRADGLAS